MQLLEILSGHPEATLAAVREQAAAAGLTDDQGKPVREAVGYLEAKRPYLDYPAALEQGWPIATGVIEGQHAT